MNSKIHILLVEDDSHLGFVIKDNLELKGYDVVHATDGEMAWELFSKTPFDICILDIMMPKLNGFELIKKIRADNQEIPVLFLSARVLNEDRITGFRLGADDYITKPFSMEELVLRLEVFLRRSRILSPSKDVFQLGEYEFDYANLSLKHYDSQLQTLTQKEADVLKLLCLHTNAVLRREDILKMLWGEDDYFMGRSLDVFISRIRKYLKADPTISILNVFSVGFKLTIKK